MAAWNASNPCRPLQLHTQDPSHQRTASWLHRQVAAGAWLVRLICYNICISFHSKELCLLSLLFRLLRAKNVLKTKLWKYALEKNKEIWNEITADNFDIHAETRCLLLQSAQECFLLWSPLVTFIPYSCYLSYSYLWHPGCTHLDPSGQITAQSRRKYCQIILCVNTYSQWIRMRQNKIKCYHKS